MACRHPLSRRRRRDTQGTALSRAIDGRIGTITDAPLPYDTPFTQLALSTLEHALRESLRANGSSIETIHMVFGLITTGSGIAHAVLVTRAISYERLRAAAESLD